MQSRAKYTLPEIGDFPGVAGASFSLSIIKFLGAVDFFPACKSPVEAVFFATRS